MTVFLKLSVGPPQMDEVRMTNWGVFWVLNGSNLWSYQLSYLGPFDSQVCCLNHWYPKINHDMLTTYSDRVFFSSRFFLSTVHGSSLSKWTLLDVIVPLIFYKQVFEFSLTIQ